MGYLLVLLAVGVAGLFAQGQLGTIRVDVQTVSVGVDVFDSTGRPVTDLTREDFRTFEDGQPREILNFASADTPYNLIFLVDCSNSTRGHWPVMTDVLAQFSQYRRPDDRILVAAFGSDIRIIQNWDEDASIEFEREPRVCALTRFHYALEWAAERLRSSRTRRGIIVLTDGVDSAADPEMQADYARTLNAFRGLGIPLYFIAVGTDVNPTWGVSGNPSEVRARLESLADVSGGRVVFPKRPEDVISMYETIARELGTSYSLGFAPRNPAPDGRNHRIQVRLTNPASNLTLRQSRNEY